jgi:hypothetical protein
MLEALVFSRIRRTLFEYLLTHPDDRFYLRGLAKELRLSVSPLRRELKRLERSGMLTVVQEGNILFYTVNATSQTFLQLKQASRQTEAPSAHPVSDAILTASPALKVSDTGTVAATSPIPIGIISADRRSSIRRSPLSSPVLVGAACVGITLVVIVAGLFYLSMTNQRLLSQTSRVLATRQAEVTVVVPPPSSSGAMRGTHWQIVPGGFGGFSSGASDESY